jgi:hypothetical protein
MNVRDHFEAAWRKEYPLHSATAFKRSGFNPDAYANTRVQDGWLMWQAARQSAGADEATLRVLPSHAIRKHEGVTIFGDPAQVLKVMAAIESVGATGQEAMTLGCGDPEWQKRHLGDPLLRAIVERDSWRSAVTGLCTIWPKTPDEAATHLRARLHPDRAAPIGDNGAKAKQKVVGYCKQGENCVCGGDLPQVRAGCCEWVSQPAESKRGELTDEYRSLLAKLANGLELAIKLAAERICISDELVAKDWIRDARALLARASAKGE